jgi:NAD(P)-dependent dehydrogenase (short-subunit alcohol dehydrogenase family)/rhamnose utilization protein RhaD (predicted bifunctional aldolase and dehydrogenase)
MKELANLVEISQYFGKQINYVIAGGGNTSFKNDRYIWVKASGTSLSTIDENGFVQLDREKLKTISQASYSENPFERERQVKDDLNGAIVNKASGLRPSVETSMHDVISFPYVVHTHPTLINGMLCAKRSKKTVEDLFPENALYIEYVDPGYTLFKRIELELSKYRDKNSKHPQIIFLENHGVFVSGNTIEEIKEIYQDIEKKIRKYVAADPVQDELETDTKAKEILPAVRMLMTEEKPVILKVRYNTLIEKFIENHDSFFKISLPFTPDIIVYCKAKYLYVETTGTAESIIERFKSQLERFKNEFKYAPKVILIKGIGLVACEENSLSAATVLDVYEDLMKISFYTENFGGPRFMTCYQIDFIDTWEVENYRRTISRGVAGDSAVVANKIAVVTGAAQGFGEGIATKLFSKNANVIIADLNEEKGAELVNKLNAPGLKNKAVFVKTDVTSPESVKNLLFRTILEFGGLDLFISNAGVLKAGSLDEIEPEVFDFVTGVNYKGYFICAKYASEILKIQAKYKDGYYTDIIQINSKSGLKGSNKNFAYAGSKFGGVGLSQSFALELIPYGIKVNSICPGNFFDGPLWSDPKNGLFVQYLHAGKVPGAKTIEEVRRYYEEQVPAGRGCRVEDVMKAVYYVIDQIYETGQAIPVTGGQIMLS